MYFIRIKSSYQNPLDQGFQGHYFKLRELQSNMQHFSYKFVPSISSHIIHQIYIIHIKSSYQIPSDQGLQGHYFKLRELQGIMQHSSHKFRSFRF